MNGSPNPADALLGQLSWIKRLAAELVSDRERANDLVQETCVAALQQDGARPSDLKRWLAGIMRNRLRQDLRGERHRRDRELAAVRPDVSRATDDVVERAAVQRRLVDAVMALDEPYRKTVLLRFFDELPQREIAKRCGIPTTTVNSRLTRGLERLRHELDRDFGERRAWVCLFLPWTEGLTPAATLTAGALLVNTKILALFALFAAGLASLLVFVSTPDAVVVAERPEEPERAAATLAAPLEATERSIAAEGVPSGAREALAVEPAREASAGAATAVAPAPAPWTLRGRVLDTNAQPVANVALRRVNGDGATLAVSGAGGDFSLQPPNNDGALAAASAEWITVYEGIYRRESSIDPVVIVAPTREVSGHVSSEDGLDLPLAFVELVMPEGFDQRFGQLLERTRPRGWDARSGDRGRFTLADLPRIDDARLRCMLEGYQAQSIPVPASGGSANFVLRRPEFTPAGRLAGRVTTPRGDPVPGARVAIGTTWTVADREGEFVVDLGRATTTDRIVAVQKGFQPATMERPLEPGEGHTGWPDYVELRLGPPPLSIEGRVVDPDGEPLPGVQVWIADATPFGVIGRMPTPLENLSAGALVPPQALLVPQRVPPATGEHHYSSLHSAGPPTAFWNWQGTSDAGRFRIDGLADRTYRLRVMDPASLIDVESAPIRAGSTGVEILFPATETRRLQGVVVDPSGRPLAGVGIHLQRDAHRARQSILRGTETVAVFHQQEHRVVSGADGEFVIERAPRGAVRLACSADHVMPTGYEVEPGSSTTEVEVVVEVRCHVEVILASRKERADAVAVEDELGRRLDMQIIRDGSVSSSNGMSLVDGKTGVFAVGGQARELVLVLGTEIVDRLPLELVPGEIVTLEL